MIQFEPMRRLAHTYEASGLRGSFNVEVMQQLAHMRLGDEHPELRDVADEWEQAVRETFARGHDIQLHLHPQWSDASYEGGRWRLSGEWSLVKYPAGEARNMLSTAIAYLEGLLRPLNPEYRCVSFRSGSWCIAPSDHLMPTLAQLGIRVDTSIVNGLFYESPHVTLDYREIDEPFLPYYPRMDDARQIAEAPQPIVTIPTHSFHANLMGFALRGVARTIRRRSSIGRRLTARFVAPRDLPIPNAGYERGEYFRTQWGTTRLEGVTSRDTKISDLCGLSFFQTRKMLSDIRARASRAGLGVVPVVLQNHTKDVGDFAPLELFARTLSAAADINVITLAQLANNLEAGRYHVRCAEVRAS